VARTPTRSTQPSDRRQLRRVQRLAGAAGALATNATISINRAASAHAAHRPDWERRQMLADARFSRRLALVLGKEAAAMSSLTHSSLMGRLGSGVLRASEVSVVAHTVAAHGLSRSLARSLRLFHVPAGERKILRSLMAGASAARGSSIRYRPLLEQSLNGAATALRGYAHNLRAYAARVNKKPRSSNAS